MLHISVWPYFMSSSVYFPIEFSHRHMRKALHSNCEETVTQRLCHLSKVKRLASDGAGIPIWACLTP